MFNFISKSAILALCLISLAFSSFAVEIKLYRFFGTCDEKSTNIAVQSGEACIIETIVRNFSERDNGITVKEMPAEWGTFYDKLKAWMVGGNPPDIFVIHKHRIPEFAGLGALAEITEEEYYMAGIDLSDFTPLAIESLTYNNKKYGVPLDFHAYLWHINVDILAKAGLVDSDGKPILPSSPEEMLKHAKKVKDATGAYYLSTWFNGTGAMRTFVALMAQQGVDPYIGKQANFTSDAARNALKAMKALGDNGFAKIKAADDEVRPLFMKGNAAIIIDGTWRVDATKAMIGKEGIALKNYYVSHQPSLFQKGGAWADTHFWAVPSTLKKKNYERYKAALKVMAHINHHNIDWARTGHLPVRLSVLNGGPLAALPYRDGYAKTSEVGYYMKPAKKYGKIQDAIARELTEYFQNDKPLDDTLEDLQEEVEDALN